MGRTANEISGRREAGDHPARRAIPSAGSAVVGADRNPKLTFLSMVRSLSDWRARGAGRLQPSAWSGVEPHPRWSSGARIVTFWPSTNPSSHPVNWPCALPMPSATSCRESLGVSPAQGPRPDHQSGLHRDEGRRRVQGQDDGAEPALADRLHLSEGDWLGWSICWTVLDDFSRYIVAWKLCTTMKAEVRHRHLGVGSQASGLDQINVWAHRPRLLSGQRAELRLGGVGGMARQTRHAAYPRRARIIR